jgi:hypothetical protein
MVNARQVGTASLENDTVESGGQILKADTIKQVTIANSHASGEPIAQPSIEHVYNIDDWFTFLEEYETSLLRKAECESDCIMDRLRDHLAHDWQDLPAAQRKANHDELEAALAAIKRTGRFSSHYREWPPTFVSRPCDDTKPPS